MRLLAIITGLVLIVLALQATTATSQTPTATPAPASADCIRANPTTTPQPTSLVSSNLATTTALAPFSPVPPPEIQGTAIPLDAMGATVTALVQQATQQVVNRTLTPQPTPTYDPNMPSELRTSTALVSNATAFSGTQTSAALTASSTPTSTLEPEVAASATAQRATELVQGFMTASAVVARATEQMRGTPSITPRPTQPPPDIDALRARWQAELVARTGLSPDVFEYYLNSLAESLMDWVSETDNYEIADWFNCLNPVVETATIDGEDFVALLLPHHEIPLLRDLMVLRGTTGQMWQIWLDELADSGGSAQIQPFADRNANGYPDLIAAGFDGRCGFQQVQFLEFRPDDVVVDLMAQITDLHMVAMVDLNNDGVQEIEAQHFVGAPYIGMGCNYVQTVSYYGWDGTAYVDISPTLNQSYWPAINQFWANLSDDAVCLMPDRAMADMLLGYEAMGRFEEGWTRLQPRFRWDACASFTPMTSFQLDNMARLLFWVGERLE